MIHWMEHHLSSCYFKSHFGLDCPGCGMQRAFISLLKGDLIESFHHHPALIPFMITVGMLLFQLKFKLNNGGKIILWLFVITSAITVINFTVKMYLHFNAA